MDLLSYSLPFMLTVMILQARIRLPRHPFFYLVDLDFVATDSMMAHSLDSLHTHCPVMNSPPKSLTFSAIVPDH